MHEEHREHGHRRGVDNKHETFPEQKRSDRYLSQYCQSLFLPWQHLVLPDLEAGLPRHAQQVVVHQPQPLNVAPVDGEELVRVVQHHHLGNKISVKNI